MTEQEKILRDSIMMHDRFEKHLHRKLQKWRLLAGVAVVFCVWLIGLIIWHWTCCVK